MKKKNKRWSILLTLLLLISVVSGIDSYFIDSENIKNTVIIGGVNVEVVEDFSPPLKLDPGTVFTKDVKVKNLGPSDCYVRIKAVFTDSDMGKYCTVDFNTKDFVYSEEDGYYYYKEVLDVYSLTPSLFTEVSLSDSISADDIKDFDILIYAEAFQSEGFDNYKDAWNYYHRNKPE